MFHKSFPVHGAAQKIERKKHNKKYTKHAICHLRNTYFIERKIHGNRRRRERGDEQQRRQQPKRNTRIHFPTNLLYLLRFFVRKQEREIKMWRKKEKRSSSTPLLSCLFPSPPPLPLLSPSAIQSGISFAALDRRKEKRKKGRKRETRKLKTSSLLSRRANQQHFPFYFLWIVVGFRVLGESLFLLL